MSETDPTRWERAQEILGDALELPPKERLTFVQEACEGDEALFAEVTSLLSAAAAADAYFDDLSDRAGITVDPDGAGDRDRSRSLEGRTIGAYELGPLLGRGGMGAVYLAERVDGQFEQTAAVKLLAMGTASEAGHRRFLSERRILARLKHPGIATLYDGGVTEDGTPYFVMEHVEGLPLTDYCTRKQLDVEQRLRTFLEICEAVSYAHRRLVVHGDLKPSNIMVTDQGEVKLLDFGIARMLESEDAEAQPTLAGPRPMTPRYASPEQLRGEPFSTATDVYSLGVVLYEVLTGMSPYEEEGEGTALREAVLDAPISAPSGRAGMGETTSDLRPPPLPPRALRRKLRGDLDNIVLTALRKEPDRRYPTVEAMAEDISRHLSGYKVSASPESLTYSVSRFLSRHALGVGIAAMFVLLLGALAVVSTRFAMTNAVQARQIARERDRAEEISHFLRDLFDIANPALTDGRSVTARELLDQGVDRIRDNHAHEPELQSEMMTVLATVYHDLGVPQDAVTLLEEAAAIQATTPEIPPEAKAETTIELGLTYQDVGEPQRAIETLTDAREQYRTLYGPNHRGVAIATQGIARAYHNMGDIANAEREFQAAVELFRNLEAEEPDEKYAESLFMVAEYLQVQGDVEGLEEIYQEALDITRTVGGPYHPNIPPILQGMAGLASRAGDVERATALIEESVALDRRLYGGINDGNHASLGQSIFTLGRHLLLTGRPERAEPLLREAIGIFEAADPARPDMHGVTLMNLGDLLRADGRVDEAFNAYRDATGVFRAAFGSGSTLEAHVLLEMGDVRIGQGRAVEAVGYLEQALASYEAVLASDHPRIVRARELLEQARGR